ncbi:hypothetical protein SAY87_025378 [Trapa incisa]|uniref:Glycoside hydrolase family 5 domain-containing protein n=1 Tax=Trapa incisa TaxID=236973 RepID=A0AAN7JGH4_9MYRT|nr:hypothetical protein SAY87_025378 [Trapa incisa]
MGYLGEISIIVLLCVSMSWIGHAEAVPLPLSTESRWIVDGNGTRVKLACVNWPSHLQPVLAEGLDKLPAQDITGQILGMGFNCVRLTWPLELPMNITLRSLTVTQNFRQLGLEESLNSIEAYNPWVVNLSLMRAFEAMLMVLQHDGLMIILDNHITTPGWCCNWNDNNGFFGDMCFNASMWIDGLREMATVALRYSNVIGMSLRNELRGPKSNIDDWYKYMQQGAETVHAANPNVLVIFSGMNYDSDLSFLHDRPVKVSFSGKLVFEVHWYSFSHGRTAWMDTPLNDVCGRISARVMATAGFLAAGGDFGGYPVFVSEFGVDMRGTDAADNRFLSCFMAAAAEQDWDFAVWGLQGSYYLRQGMKDLDETFGLLNHSWTGFRNSITLKRISSLQRPFRGPGLSQTAVYQVIFHPLTGLCIGHKNRLLGPIRLEFCSLSPRWTYTAQRTLEVMGTQYVLQSSGDFQKPIELMASLPDQASQWVLLSGSKLQLASTALDGSSLCLDVFSNDYVITEKCKCLDSNDPTCDPASQWFRLVDSTMP